MSESSIQVKLTILDKDYNVACHQPEEKEALHKSARMLDERMREIRAAGKIVGTERIAVMAALNLAYELLKEQTREEGYTHDINTRLKLMQERIEAALGEEDQQMRL